MWDIKQALDSIFRSGTYSKQEKKHDYKQWPKPVGPAGLPQLSVSGTGPLTSTPALDEL